jgi:hypothetical protein
LKIVRRAGETLDLKQQLINLVDILDTLDNKPRDVEKLSRLTIVESDPGAAAT